ATWAREPCPSTQSPLHLTLKPISIEHARKPQRGQHQVRATMKARQVGPPAAEPVLQHRAVRPRPATFRHRQVGPSDCPPLLVTRDPYPLPTSRHRLEDDRPRTTVRIDNQCTRPAARPDRI